MKIIKNIVTVVLVITLIICTFISASAEGTLNWYIKRCKGKAPLFPREADEISSYNAYYIDKGASEKGDKVIYLTFDAGYANENIERILDILKSENVPAAFFLLDNIILKNTDLVNRMADEGHLVCNHTKNHKNLSSAGNEEIIKNLTALEMIYKEKTGKEMAKFFRFPEGSYSINALKCINEMGYKTVFWSFAYDDWDNNRQPNTEKAIRKVLDGTHPGAIMLFHPTSNTNAEILPRLIREWRNMGYSFASLDQLVS